MDLADKNRVDLPCLFIHRSSRVVANLAHLGEKMSKRGVTPTDYSTKSELYTSIIQGEVTVLSNINITNYFVVTNPDIFSPASFTCLIRNTFIKSYQPKIKVRLLSTSFKTINTIISIDIMT